MTSPDESEFDSPPGRMVTVKASSCAVIGDIHGRADLLERLLAQIPTKRTVLVAGDLCDRGPDTRRVLDLLIARGARGALGNHEEWLLRWSRAEGFIHEARAMGATATLASYGVTATDEREVSRLFRKVPREHVAFLESLGHAVDLRVGGANFWVIHAGIGTTSSPRDRTHARANWPGVHPLAADNCRTRSTNSMLREKFSPVKRGKYLRKSPSVKSSGEVICPVRKPRPSGL